MNTEVKPVALTAGGIVVLRTLEKGPVKLAKQLVWQTGFELRSTRNASVNFRLRVAFHSSCPYTPIPHRAIGTLVD